jgi:murein L,D-transpeptidase YcbB/YkuD
MPNTHGVYLHGSPSKGGFLASRRDLSHGCIRVEDPETLAVWALRDRPDWTAKRVHEAMLGRRTITVPIVDPIPVLIQYGTAAVDEGDEVRFFEDIYGNDAAEGEAFEKRAQAAR